MADTRKTPVLIIREFFGYKPGQTLKEFTDEVKALTAEDKQELAGLAAKVLVYTQDQVAFPLSA